MRRGLPGPIAAALALTALVLSSAGACGPVPGIVNPQPSAAGAAPVVNITAPANAATDVSTAVEITYTATGATTTTVALKDAQGQVVEGAMHPDGKSWLPNAQLAYGTAYTATVTAANANGISSVATSTFTTMARPSDLVDITSFNGDDLVYGVGMPIMITFGVEVPQKSRAAIQRRLIVRTDPPQQGTWVWTDTDGDGNLGNEARYRPKEYWKAGTKVDVRAATGGLAWGLDNWYGSHDLTLHFTIGDAVLIDITNSTHQMKVTQNGTLLRTIPVSLGRPAYPSSSGTMLIMERREKNHFTSESIDIPPGSPSGYSVDVSWTMQLTYRGEYIHAAPWSVADQGKRNVSHGCVNVSTANAIWLYNLVKVGTPVTIKGTEVNLIPGNGWTDWNVSWDEYIKGSALPA